MNILALTRYGRLGPSSRIRFYQYLPYLQSHGLQIDIASLQDNSYVRNLYANRRDFSFIEGYFKRLYKLLFSKKYDLLWIEKQLFPWLPTLAETLLEKIGIPYIVDYDDAVFHRYDQHPNSATRAILGKSIDTVMRHAQAVVAGSPYLAERAQLAGAKSIHEIPSVVDLERYEIRKNSSMSESITLGWIGSPATQPYLDVIHEPLFVATNNFDFKLSLIGASQTHPLDDLNPTVLSWNENTEVEEIRSFDIGIMPLFDGPFEKGKCGYKLIQYMACGLPVVASSIGINNQLIKHGENGYLAQTKEDWLDAFLKLRDPAIRSKMGQVGRQLIEEKYSLQVNAPRLLSVLLDACGK